MNRNTKMIGILALIPALVACGWGAKTAYEHRGFFAYHVDQLVSPAHATAQEELMTLVRTDPRAAFARFREILKADPYSYNACHGIAHQMGHEAFEALGFAKAMSFQDALCGGGYIHGVIEARFGLLREADLLTVLPTVCASTAESCYHGIGHGLMIATKLNIQKSITYCGALPALSRRNCYDGVWMHVFDAEESGTHASSAATVPDIPAAIAHCDTAIDAARTSCFFYLPRIYAHGTEVAFGDYADLCGRLTGAPAITCAVGTGHAIMKYHIADPNISISRCKGFPTEALVNACREGSALYYLFASETRANSVCDVFTEKTNRALCRRVNMYRESL